MDRKKFISVFGLGNLFLAFSQSVKTQSIQPEELYFKDDGMIPNSKFPLLIYRNVFTEGDKKGAAWLEKLFASNNWTNSWRNGIFSYHHYHSTSHEALGIYSGNALVHLGG